MPRHEHIYPRLAASRTLTVYKRPFLRGFLGVRLHVFKFGNVTLACLERKLLCGEPYGFPVSEVLSVRCDINNRRVFLEAQFFSFIDRDFCAYFFLPFFAG